MSKRLGWPWAVLGLVLLFAACDVKVGDNGVSVDFAVGKATDDWRRSYSIQPGARLEIINVNGAIHASSSSGAQVDVHAMREARAGSEDAARKILGKAEMREEISPDRVSVTSPDDQGEGVGFRPRLTIRYEVRIPPDLNVLLKTQNGEVRLDNIQGRITASTTNGRITGSGIAGSIDASTVNGGIQMDLKAVTGETRLVTVNGGIQITVPPGVNADLDAGVVNGAVVVQDRFPLTADARTRQRVAGRIGNGGPRIVVQTTNGGVRVGTRGEPGP